MVKSTLCWLANGNRGLVCTVDRSYWPGIYFFGPPSMAFEAGGHMEDYNTEKLTENLEHYRRAWNGSRDAHRALIRFWMIGNGAGAAISLNFLANAANRPEAELQFFVLAPTGLFLLGLLAAWVGFRLQVTSNDKILLVWQDYLTDKNKAANPPLMEPLDLMGKGYYINIISGFSLLLGVISAVWVLINSLNLVW